MTIAPGVNLEGIIEDDIDSILNIKREGDSKIKEELKIKKVKKFNFGKLITAPKDSEKAMGMDNIFDGEAFEGLGLL